MMAYFSLLKPEIDLVLNHLIEVGTFWVSRSFLVTVNKNNLFSSYQDTSW